ncbi:MAG: glycogen synthase GlgA [Armatimonadota bacterium]|nr:glycogen synthase GlgA [Armatimonadota bacterium]MDR7439134.1 glycogen synthase GlgA [Armatimonadota bacterium]MDR7562145.1 glycogen synthase GlgA [Armatimonadota bacterium]MDR7567619.1 glycogen synthase GlgA [Armatimonadota bacterium]
MRVLFVVAEMVPFAKTGGLADVAGALPPALHDLGVEVRVLMPRYAAVDPGHHRLEPVGEISAPVGGRGETARVWEGNLAGKVPVWFLDHPGYYGRPGIYGEGGKDYEDNLHRFTFLCRASLNWARVAGWVPDVFHCHDWHAALVPVYLDILERRDPLLGHTATLFTIHNLAYQGIFPREHLPVTGLPEEVYWSRLEFYGSINLMKGALLSADLLNTVSETYAREIQTPEFGYGLDGVLRTRGQDLYGVLNGVDYSVWDPRVDPYLPARYGPEDLSGKRICKLALQAEFGLPENPKVPLVGMVTRLVDQKGLDLVQACLDRMVAAGAQFVLLGTGDPRYEVAFTEAARRYPRQVGVRIGFDEGLAHRIEAGCDIFLMPSRYEPSGLNQLYSLRYGTVPVVRRTGGLADSIVDATPETVARGEANGFVFEAYAPDALWEALRRALDAFRNPALWRTLVQAGMRADFSWKRSARRYVEMYERACAKRRR